MLAYKATLPGSVCVKVDADYTSQSCPSAASAARRTAKGQGCSLSASSVATRCMRIWWEPGISSYERWSFGRTGWPRGNC